MADDSTNPTPPRSARRSSFAGETFANLFGGHRASISRASGQNNTGSGEVKQGQGDQQQPPQSYAGPITTAAAQAQKRRLSLTTLGLSGSPNQSSAFGSSYPGRRDSYTSGTSDSIDESAIEDEYGPAAPAPTPATPFGRRLSFGAKALRDVRTGSGGTTPPGQNGQQTSAPSNANTSVNGQKAQNGTISSRDAKGRGSEGFNWSDNFRSRAERTSSIAGGGMSGFMSGGGAGSPRAAHGRAQSVAVMEPPIREMPKPKEQIRPDHFQERILKGDFYMD